MARLRLTVALTTVLATVLLSCASADAHDSHTSQAHVAGAPVAKAKQPIQPSTTDPVALALEIAERYWHGVPACGAPAILTSPDQLPDSDYESTSNPEPRGSVVEMWTEVQACTIMINASLWGSWHQDDESFQWFCDAMTHEVGHLFGHLDSGQTNPASVTYPFLDSTSPNFDSVPGCRNVTLQYGPTQIRNEEIIRRTGAQRAPSGPGSPR